MRNIWHLKAKGLIQCFQAFCFLDMFNCLANSNIYCQPPLDIFIIMKIIKNKTKNDKYEYKYVLGYQLVFNDGYVYLTIVCDCHEKDIMSKL
jgi:hypothetical protein